MLGVRKAEGRAAETLRGWAPCPSSLLPQRWPSLLSACGPPFSCSPWSWKPASLTCLPPAPPLLQGGSPKAQSCPAPQDQRLSSPPLALSKVQILQGALGACGFTVTHCLHLVTLCSMHMCPLDPFPSPGFLLGQPSSFPPLGGGSLSFASLPWPPLCAPIPQDRPCTEPSLPMVPAVLPSDTQRPQGPACWTDPSVSHPGSVQKPWGHRKGPWRQTTGTSVSGTHLHLLVNPVQEGGDASVDPGLVHVSTADAKTRSSHQLPHPPLLTHQRPPAVSLDGKERGTVGGVPCLSTRIPTSYHKTRYRAGSVLSPPASEN